MKDYREYLDWISSPAILAEKILNEEFGFNEFFLVFTQDFDSNNRVPVLARAIYRASIIGSFNDKFISRDLLKTFLKSEKISGLSFNYHQTLNIFYIYPELLCENTVDIFKSLVSLKGSNLFWLFSNPDAFAYAQSLLDQYLIKVVDVDHNESIARMQIVVDQASAVYGVKPMRQAVKKITFEERVVSFSSSSYHESPKDQIQSKDVTKPAKLVLDKPRVAVCITGQFRAFNQAFDSWTEFLQPDAHYDFYVSTWKTTGYKKFSWAHIDRILSKEAANYLTQLKASSNQLKNFDNYCENFFDSVGATELKNEVIASQLSRYGELIALNFFSETDEKFLSMSNSEKMYFHNMCAFHSVVESGKTYDAIVKIRPDMLIGYRRFPRFWNRLSIEFLSNLKMYAETGYRFEEWGFGCGDQIAIGSQDMMRRYCTVYERREFHKSYQQYVCENHIDTFQGHVSVGVDLWMSGIDIGVVPLELRGLASDKKYTLEEIKPLIETLKTAHTNVQL